MSPEEMKRRAEDNNVKFLKDRICDHTGDKSYVFISYKSDDWKVVLNEIVYKLVKEYGLNVYFDGSFDEHNNLWIDQVKKNMGNYKCKGVLAFFDDEYATSYAALMELMYSQSRKATATMKEKDDGLPIVSIDLKELTDITGEEGQRKTGLGVRHREDNSLNVNAEAELEWFATLFKELLERRILKKAGYLWNKNDEELSKAACSIIIRELKASKRINQKYYYEGISFDDIAKSIRDACGSEVFSKPENQDKQTGAEPTPDNRENTMPLVNDKPDQSLTTGTTGHINEKMTLEQFEKICETTDICRQMKSIRTRKRGSVQPFDYLMASLLRGCDEPNRKKETILRKAADTYCHDAVSEDIKSNQFTWCSNARKYMRREEMPVHFFKEDGTLIGSGHLEEYSELFKNLNSQMTLGELIEKYKKKEKGFDTKNNDEILEAWEEIKKIVFQYNA